MKTKLLPIIAITSFLALSLPSQASILISEDFTGYTVGNGTLTGSNGGSGWNGAWTTSSGNGGDIVSPGLAGTPTGARTETGNGGIRDIAIASKFGGIAYTGDIYVGFSFSPATYITGTAVVRLAGSSGDFPNFIMGVVGGTNSPDNPYSFRGAVPALNDEIKISSSEVVGGASAPVVRLVYRLAYTLSGVTMTQWVNPLSETSGSVSSATNAFANFQVDNISLRSSGPYSPASFDNFTVATTFAEAVAIPEPSALILVVGAFAVTYLRRHRRIKI